MRIHRFFTYPMRNEAQQQEAGVWGGTAALAAEAKQAKQVEIQESFLVCREEKWEGLF